MSRTTHGRYGTSSATRPRRPASTPTSPAGRTSTCNAAYYHISKDKAQQKTNDLLKTVGLADVADRLAGTYSGGMKRRLDLATALVSEPDILFLDEPTTGLDPQSRRAIWDHIRDLNRKGTTIFLTTQYMEEADQLAHRLCIIDNGKIVAEGEPGKLKGQIGADMIKLVVKNGDDVNVINKALETVRQLPGVKEVQDCSKGGVDCTEGIVIYGADGSNLVPLIVRSLDTEHIEIENLVLAKPSLDDVFIKFTGKAAPHRSGKAPAQGRFPPEALR